jgi:hypothetical protein
MTSYYSVDVCLQFPAMPRPYRVEVTVRDLYYLDRNTERTLGTDGSVVYRLPRPSQVIGRKDPFRMEMAAMPA